MSIWALVEALRAGQSGATKTLSDLATFAEAAATVADGNSLGYVRSVLDAKVRSHEAINGTFTPDELLAAARTWQILAHSQP